MNKTRTESVCSCSICKLMCKTSPCFPTPDEAIRLIQAGYQSRLAISIYIDPNTAGYHPAITGIFDDKDGCVFQNETRLCELHDTGLKPMEGRLAHHSLSDSGLRLEVARTWETDLGYQVLNAFPTPDQEWKKLALLSIKRNMIYAKYRQTDSSPA